jgi:hypothetical protein
MGPFYLGLFVGLLIKEGLEKNHGEDVEKMLC